MKTVVKLFAVGTVAALMTACGSMNDKTPDSLTPDKVEIQSAKQRAEDAYTKAQDAMEVAQRAERKAEEANVKSERMLNRSAMK